MNNRFDYLQIVLAAFCTGIPPINEVKKIDTGGFIELQDWVSSNLRPEFSWCTGLSVIDTAEYLYDQAIANGNIKYYIN